MHIGNIYVIFIPFPNNRMNLFQGKDEGKQDYK